MKKILALIVISLLFAVVSGGGSSFGQTPKPAEKAVAPLGMFAQPLVVAWFYAAETTHLNPIADAERVFLPMADGSISAVSLSTGELLWKSAAGAELTASPIECNGELVVAAKKGTSGGEASSGVLRVL